jgi:nucleoside-diphosphate-sugar epimerase
VELFEGFQGARVLVVGGAGFVGSNLVRGLLDHAREVVVVDNLLSAERTNLPDAANLTFVEGSIADDAILAKLDDTFDHAFHLATYHGNQSSIHDPLADHENNLLTSLKLFNHLRAFRRLTKLVYSGAGCAAAKKTFDDAQATTEEAPLSIVQDSPYSISKLVGELYAAYFHKQHGLPVVRARFQNVYGPGEVLGAGRWRGTPATVWRNVTPTFVYKALHRQPLPLENEGLATRDFIFVDDICRGLAACALRGAPGDVYNLASGREWSIRQLAETINELTGNDAGVQLLPARAWDTSGKRYGSTEKAARELDFSARVELREGLARTVAWTREQLPRIERCIDRHRAQLAAAAARTGAS